MKFRITPQSWAFGLRTWAAMVLALLAAFWLQLDGAASAAVCVGILALPTRGQMLQKGFYRVAATAIGVAVSIVIAGAFAQARDLLILAFAIWLAICVFAAGLLEGNRAYGAVLSGYTVAIVTIGQIDSPQDLFTSGINRGLAEVIGIAALAVVNDILFAPDLLPGLRGRLEATHAEVRAFTRHALVCGFADLAVVAALLASVTALRADITALPGESVSGQVRAAAARIAAIAMVRRIMATRVVAAMLARLGPEGDGPRAELLAALDDPSGNAAFALRDRLMQAPIRDLAPERLVARSAVLVLLEQDCRAVEALASMRSGHGPARAPGLPLFRSRRAAFRGALRAFLAVLLSAFVLIVAGWPATSQVLLQLAALVGISATNPNPRAFAAGALAAMPLAALAGGVVQFLVLDGADAFPLLAIAMAPVVLVASLLIMSGNQRLFGAGFLLLVFFPVFLDPQNPQTYNPLAFLESALLANTAVIGLYLTLAVMLPTTDAMRQRWIEQAGRDELADAIGGRTRTTPPLASFRDADRIAQLGQLDLGSEAARTAALRRALATADLTAALRRLRFALQDSGLRTQAPHAVSEAETGVAALDPASLRRAAARITALDRHASEMPRAAARQAAAELVFVAALLDSESRTSEEHGSRIAA